MTKEEKVNLLNELLEYEENNDIGNLTRIERREFQQWISEALEQKSILGEIRAEIIDTGAYEQEVNGKTEFLKGINYCLDVIDRHKLECDEKE